MILAVLCPSKARRTATALSHNSGAGSTAGVWLGSTSEVGPRTPEPGYVRSTPIPDAGRAAAPAGRPDRAKDRWRGRIAGDDAVAPSIPLLGYSASTGHARAPAAPSWPTGRPGSPRWCFSITAVRHMTNAFCNRLQRNWGVTAWVGRGDAPCRRRTQPGPQAPSHRRPQFP